MSLTIKQGRMSRNRTLRLQKAVLESLEPRILLSTTWTRGANNNDFFDAGNWSSGLPSGTNDAIFDASGTYTGAIQITQSNQTILGISVTSVAITLDLDGNSLTTTQETKIGSTAQNETANLTVTNTSTSRATLKTNGVQLADQIGATGTLSASGNVDVKTTDASSITSGVSGHALLKISGGAHVTSNGVTELFGPSGGSGSSISLTGQGSQLDIGNLTIGDDTASAVMGNVTVSDHADLKVEGHLNVYANSGGAASVEVQNASLEAGALYIGNVGGPTNAGGSELAASPPSLTATGSNLTIGEIFMDNGGHFTMDQQSNMTVGDGYGDISLGNHGNLSESNLTFQVIGGSNVTVGTFHLDRGSHVEISGNQSSFHFSNVSMVGKAEAASLTVGNGASLTGDGEYANITVGGFGSLLTFGNANDALTTNVSFYHLQFGLDGLNIGVKANVTCDSVTTIGKMDIFGNLTSNSTTTQFVIGDGSSNATVKIEPSGSVNAKGGVLKKVRGDVKGNSITAQILKTDGLNADIMPGDYFTRDTSGKVIAAAASNGTFDTMIITGILDASLGMTLDEVFGSTTGTNSSLTVTGNVTLGPNCNLRIALASGQDPTTYISGYSVNDSFTLLSSSNGTVTGKFVNLPAPTSLGNGTYVGTYVGNGLLPALADGLEWQVTYTSNALTVTVIAEPTSNITHWTNADTHDLEDLNDPLNWDNGLPGPGNIGDIPANFADGNLFLSQDLSVSRLTVEGSVFVTLNGHSLAASGDIVVGAGGNTEASFDMSGGTIACANLQIGASNYTSSNSMTLDATHLIVTGTIDIGGSSISSLSFNNGSLLDASTLIIGNAADVFFGSSDANVANLVMGSTELGVTRNDGLVANLVTLPGNITCTNASVFDYATIFLDGGSMSTDELVDLSNGANGTGLGVPIGAPLQVNGNANVSGNLLVSSLSGVTPDSFSLGDFFDLISSSNGTISGQFTNISGLPTLSSGLNWEIVYSPTSVTAVVVTQDVTFAVASNALDIAHNSVIEGSDTLEVSDGLTTILVPSGGLNSFTVDATGVTGNVILATGADASGLTLANGTFEVISNNAITVNSTLVLASATLLIDSGATCQWNGGNIADDGNGASAVVNNGTFNYASSGQCFPANITNNGTINWFTGFDCSWQVGGTIIFHAYYYILDDSVVGPAHYEVADGATLAFIDDAAVSDLSITVDSGGTLNWYAAIYVFGQMSIDNYGTLNYGDGINENAGLVGIYPGGSLTVNNYGTINGTLQDYF